MKTSSLYLMRWKRCSQRTNEKNACETSLLVKLGELPLLLHLNG